LLVNASMKPLSVDLPDRQHSGVTLLTLATLHNFNLASCGLFFDSPFHCELVVGEGTARAGTERKEQPSIAKSNSEASKNARTIKPICIT